MNPSEIKLLVIESIEETLESDVGSFYVLALRASPEVYVQWIKVETGLLVEISDTDFIAGIPLPREQLDAIECLGFERQEWNFSQEFASADTATASVLGALQALDMLDGKELRLTKHNETSQLALGSEVESLSRGRIYTPTPGQESEAKIAWFRGLFDVPGIRWKPPHGLEIDSCLSNARPYSRESYDPETIMVEWMGEDGAELPYDDFDSPVEWTMRRLDETNGTGNVVRLVSTALSLPGTRHEYFAAINEGISRLQVQRDDDPSTWGTIEDLAHLAIELVGTGLEETAVSDFYADKQSQDLGAALRPFETLIRLYASEGFLVEARAIHESMNELPIGKRRSWTEEVSPAEIIGALTELNHSYESNG